MGSILTHSDGVVVIENDMAKQVCQSKLAIKLPSFSDMNSLIAHHLASVFAPLCASKGRFAPIISSESDILYKIRSRLLQTPAKLLSISVEPLVSHAAYEFESNSWESLFSA